jgi:hypothetical protein
MGRGLGPVAKGISRLPVEPRSLPRRRARAGPKQQTIGFR